MTLMPPAPAGSGCTRIYACCVSANHRRHAIRHGGGILASIPRSLPDLPALPTTPTAAHLRSEMSHRHGPALSDTICPTAQRCARAMRPDSERVDAESPMA